MRSAFSRSSSVGITASSKLQIDETYNLRGLNMILPDQLMQEKREDGRSPYTINSRMFAREDGQNRVGSRTRRGSARLSTAVGETLDTQNVAAAGGNDAYAFGDLGDDTRRILAMKWRPTTTGALTRLDLEMRKDSGSFGHARIEVYSDAGGFPGTLMGSTSVLGLNLTTSMAYLTAYLMDAPTVSNSVDYWIVVFIQDNGVGTYYWQQTNGTAGLASADGGESWGSAGGDFRFKTYIATVAPIKGFFRRYPSAAGGANLTLLASLGKIQSVTDAGVTADVDTSLNSASTFVRFEHIDDKTVWVNSLNNPRYTSDGITSQDLTNAPANASHVIAHQNRLMFVVDKVKVIYSALYDFTSYPSVNFFYVPNPKSSDPITGWCRFQNSLVIFTHETKHIVRGSDVSTFQRDEAVGTKGAVSQEAIAVDKNGIYFMADDGQIYFYNGVSDELISDRVQPELQGITDKSKVRLHLYNNQLRVYYCKTPDTANDRMLLFDIVSGEWFMDTGRSVVGSLEWTQDSNQLIEFSSKVTWVFTGEQGYSDVGKPISYKYWTPYKKYGSGASKKRVKSFRPVVRLSTNGSDYTLLVGKDVDFLNSPDMREYIVSGGGAKWGQFVWGDGTKWGGRRMVDKRSGMSGRGRHIQYRFEAEYVEAPVEVYGYISQLKEGRPK